MSDNLSLLRYNFNKAAKSYQSHALMQKSTARYLQSLVEEIHQGGIILDLGSGPGTLNPQPLVGGTIVNYDLSLPMLKAGTLSRAVNGDAAMLPFATGSIATMVSNMMLQWPHNKNAVFSEISRVLDSGGYLLFATLVKGSLCELETAWQKVDKARHTLEFLLSDTYLQLCQAHGLTIINSSRWGETYYFSNIHELFHHFRLTGTTMPKSDATSGLGGRRKLKELEEAYEEIRTRHGLPLTYKFLVTIARKD